MFTLKAYEEMKKQFAIKVAEVLLRNHQVKKIEDLPELRRGQVQFINQFILKLDEYKPERADHLANLANLKAKILTGCLYVVSDLIKISYEKSMLFRVRDPKNSDLFTILQEVMGVSDANQLDLTTIRLAMEQTERFLCEQLCVDGSLSKGLKIDHPFFQSEQFDLKGFTMHMLEIRETVAKAAWVAKFDAAVAAPRAKEKPVESASSSAVSVSASMFSAKPVKPSDLSTLQTGAQPQ